MPELPSKTVYQIWYVPEFPLCEVNSSTKVDRTGREEWREALAEDIARQGLVNPLIIINHRGDGWHGNWLMTGTNRLWAIRSLGWTHAPAIVTGVCDKDGKVPVKVSELQQYFPDGEIYIGTHGPRLRNVCKPENYEYPNGEKNPQAR
jgi:hypothetical protein